MSDFLKAVNLLIDRLEGGDRVIVDSGGTTKFGVSQHAYPNLDIANLTREGAIALYHKDYWLPCGAEGLEWPLSFVHFDGYVQNKVKAMQWIAVADDANDYLLLQLDFYGQLRDADPNRPLHGWVNRIRKVYKLTKEECP